MLTPIAPWLQTNPLMSVDASAKGAGLGLQASQIATGANEAADRLRLSYAQLAAEQAMHADTTAASRQHAAAELALRGSLADREREMQLGRLGVSTRHQDMLEQNAADRLKQLGAEKLLHVGQGVYGYDPKTGTFNTKLEPPEHIDPYDELDYKAASRRASGAAMALRRPELDKDTKDMLQKELDAANADMRAIKSRRKGGRAGLPDLSTPTNPVSEGGQFSQVPDWYSAWQRGTPQSTLLGEPTLEDYQGDSGTNTLQVGKYKVTPLK